MSDRKTIRVPALFWNDHAYRECESQFAPDRQTIEIKENSRYIWLSMTPEAISELLSDARYYSSEFTGEDAIGIRGIIMSARATVKAIKAQTVERQGGSRVQTDQEPPPHQKQKGVEP